ncbi:MAG TPA: hypothetical protein DEZ27_05400 [Sphaerochaeta sp.]|nr:hypothetical protein [Sphaerochaeta sp.]
MFYNYYVNKNAQVNGDHEVHREDCAKLPLSENRIYLGAHEDCFAAVVKARTYYSQVDGCKICCYSCHTS